MRKKRGLHIFYFNSRNGLVRNLVLISFEPHCVNLNLDVSFSLQIDY